MRQAIEDGSKSIAGFLLAGIGVQLPAHHYLGGLFMALAGAAFARAMLKEQDTREWGVVFLGAFVLATVGAMLNDLYNPPIIAQAMMCGLGFGSRFLARAMLAFMGLIETRADVLFDRWLDWILPSKKP